MKTYFPQHASFLFSMVFFLMAVLSSCVRHDDNLLVRMEEIKELGNHNPQLAMQKLDSLQNEMDNADAYILNKYSLLSIRLQDKAYILAKSDTPIMRLVRYFKSHGSTAERQEAYYYAGSAYRDLQDTPKALEYFLKSADCCEGMEGIDSVMLRNTYSQLNVLYYNVQDYSNALTMARNVVDVEKKLDLLTPRSILREGSALYHLDSLDVALVSFENALDCIERTQSYSMYKETVVSLLYYFIIYKKLDKAEKCYQLIRSDDNFPVVQDLYLNLGNYLLTCRKMDSALVYYNRALEEGPTMFDRQTAAKTLLKYHYFYGGDKEQLRYYGMRYVELSDTLDFKVRQQEAATTNNRYKYFKNKEEMLLLQEEKNKYRMLLIVVSAVALVLLFALASFFLFRRNKRLRELLEKTRELKSTKEENRRMQTELIQQKEELEGLGKKIRENSEQLVRMKEEQDKSETELTRAREEVASRMEQSRQLLQMLQRTQFAENAHDVIQQIQEASEGHHTMTPEDWKKFHAAVNLLYPDLNDKIVEHLGERITEQQLRICHLMRIGMTNPQIERLTDIPKVTVWRWVKKYEWVLE